MNTTAYVLGNIAGLEIKDVDDRWLSMPKMDTQEQRKWARILRDRIQIPQDDKFANDFEDGFINGYRGSR
jgi:hypothetical protein